MKKSPSKIKQKSIINKAEVGRILGVSRQYVGQLLNGRRHNAERIAQIEQVIHSELGNFKREGRRTGSAMTVSK